MQKPMPCTLEQIRSTRVSTTLSKTAFFRTTLTSALLAVSLITSPTVRAEVAGGKTVTLVVAATTNTTVDTLARLIAPQMAKTLGQNVVVENKPGGNGLVAGTLVAKAAPDGATLLVDSSSFAVPPGPSRKTSYDPVRAFKPLAVLALFPYVFVTFGPYPAKSTLDVVAMARRSPNEVAFASTGTGSAQHLAAAQFEDLAGIDLLNIPYRNSGLALSDVASRQVPLLFADYVSVQPHLKESRLRALAVTGKRRLPQLPDVPTMQQAGVAEYEVYEWSPVVAPAGVTPDTVRQLSSAIATAVKSPEFIDKVRELGGEPYAAGDDEAEMFVAAQRKMWTKVVGNRRIKLD